MKQKFLCPSCEYNWRGCHNPHRPNVTKDEGCSDFWRRGKKREPELEEPSKAWLEGLDLRGFGKKKPRRQA